MQRWWKFRKDSLEHFLLCQWDSLSDLAPVLEMVSRLARGIIRDLDRLMLHLLRTLDLPDRPTLRNPWRSNEYKIFVAASMVLAFARPDVESLIVITQV